MFFQFAAVVLLLGVGQASRVERRGPDPLGQVEPGTSSACTWWYENKDGSIECAVVPAIMEIEMADWLAWNPGLTEDCGNFRIGYSYCIEVSATTTTSGGPPTPTSTTTTPNGITTPSPTLPGNANNCWKFHIVKTNETCEGISEENDITERRFHTLNPYIGSDCRYLPVGTNVCVGTFDSVPVYKNHGCYTEAYVGLPDSPRKTRALSHASVVNYDSLTLEWCAIYCMQEKQSLFGVETGNQCWCGNSLNIGSTKVSDENCNKPCSGNDGQTCGGSDHLSIYGAENSTAPIAYRPWGCYTEGTNNRALGLDSLWAEDMTVEKCGDYCLGEKGTAHFNVQNSIECWCGNNLGLGAVLAPETDCNTTCAGDKEQICGSPLGRLNLYSSSATEPPMKFNNLGCHTELSSGEALPDDKFEDTVAMTVEKCGKFCIDKGHKTFGLRAGNHCGCAAELDPGFKEAPQSECDADCSGNSEQTCGGTGRINVFEWQ